jgi:hypothetical protein
MDVILYPVARIVREYLASQSVGVAFSQSSPNTEWSIHTAKEPNAPVNCITVFDETEMKIAKTINGTMDRPTVSIRIRSASQAAGDYRAKLVLQAMDSLSGWTWEGDETEYEQTVLIRNAIRSRGILRLGANENNHWLFNLEYALVIQSIEQTS